MISARICSLSKYYKELLYAFLRGSTSWVSKTCFPDFWMAIREITSLERTVLYFPLLRRILLVAFFITFTKLEITCCFLQLCAWSYPLNHYVGKKNLPSSIPLMNYLFMLQNAFCSTPYFEPFAIPLLLDKLSSSLPLAKVCGDSQTMSTIINYYSHFCSIYFQFSFGKSHNLISWGPCSLILWSILAIAY